MRIGSATGPTLPAGRSVAGVADFNGDTHPDYLLFNAATRGTVIWYLSGVTRTGSRNGPTIPAGFEVAGLADFDGNADPTICFTIRAHAKQQFGTSTIICSLATPPVRLSGAAGASSHLDRSENRSQDGFATHPH